MMDKKQDPYKVQLADISNEIGGNMTIKYYTLDFTLTNEQLQEVKEYVEKAHNAGAAPSVTFEAPDDGALNIQSPEENPELDKLVKAMGI